MDICFEGIGQVVATFWTEDETLEAGMAVTLKDSGTVGLSSKDNALCGVTVGAARGGAVAVQIGGVVKVGCADDEPELGWQELVCDGDGGVKTVGEETGGMKFLVLAADEAEDEEADRSKKSVVVKL